MYDVIIPIHNCKNYLEVCLQTLENTVTDEMNSLILIDDKSDTDTHEYIKQYFPNPNKIKKILKIYNDKNLYFTRTVNKGLKATKQEYVFIINSDCILKKGWIEEYFQVMQITNATLLGMHDSSINYKERYTIIKPPNYVTGHCWLIKTKVFDDIGYLKEDSAATVHYGSDEEYSHRLNAHGYITAYTHHSGVIHDNYKHPSARTISQNDDELNSLTKNIFENGYFEK